jgi:hypothetical protein
MSEDNGRPKGKLAQLLAGATKERNRIVLLNSEDEDIGVAVNYEDFDGQTKLTYDNRIDRALMLRGNKQVVALQDAIAWLFTVKLKDIEGLERDVDCGGLEPKEFFLTDPDGIILMRTATNEYLRRNRVSIGDSKN